MGGSRRSVMVDGVTLGYTLEGRGMPLLVVGSSIFYPRTFSRNLKKRCLLVCADLPHFAPLESGFDPKVIGFDFYGQCIEAVRVDAGLGRIAVVGHSHHGNVALEYAKRYPGNVSHVVLIGTPPVDIARTIEGAERYWDAHASEQWKTILRQRREAIDAGHRASLSPQAAYVSQYVTDAPLYWNDPSYDATWLWDGMTFDMAAIGAFRDLYRVYRMEWEAQSLGAPVLVVMGENDYAVPHTLWEDVLPRLENVTFHVFPHSGHTPQLEEPDVFDQLLLDWLLEIDTER